MNLPYDNIPDYPEAYDGPGVLTRLIDGLGFRFRWATEGLQDEDFDFRPGPESMSVAELVHHIHDLIQMVREALGMEPAGSKSTDPRESVAQSLGWLCKIRERLAEPSLRLDEMTLRDHPFWHAINGPLADALTHVGQINLCRRLGGNPAPKVSVFKGQGRRPA